MYISKKLLILLLMIGSVIMWVTYAASSISSVDNSVTSWDTITADYFNNVNTLLNWTKTAWWYCKYDWTQITCIDDTVPATCTENMQVLKSRATGSIGSCYDQYRICTDGQWEEDQGSLNYCTP